MPETMSNYCKTVLTVKKNVKRQKIMSKQPKTISKLSKTKFQKPKTMSYQNPMIIIYQPRMVSKLVNLSNLPNMMPRPPKIMRKLLKRTMMSKTPKLSQ